MGYAAPNPYAVQGSAISAEAGNVSCAVETVIRAVENSQTLFGIKSAAIAQLKNLADECADSDWDGAGADPVDAATVQNVENFLRALPDTIPMPEFAPDPDGSVSLDWIVSRHQMFSLSIGPTNRLAYAWLDGTDKGHAVAYFDEHNIPVRILDGIQATLVSNNAIVRVA